MEGEELALLEAATYKCSQWKRKLLEKKAMNIIITLIYCFHKLIYLITCQYFGQDKVLKPRKETQDRCDVQYVTEYCHARCQAECCRAKRLAGCCRAKCQPGCCHSKCQGGNCRTKCQPCRAMCQAGCCRAWCQDQCCHARCRAGHCCARNPVRSSHRWCIRRFPELLISGYLFLFLPIVFIVGGLINLFPTTIFLINWIKCPIKYYGICYNIVFHSDDTDHAKIPDLVLKNLEQGQYMNETTTQVKLQGFEDFAKLVLLFTTFSSFFSFVFFACALWWLHYKQYKIKYFKDPSITAPLDPFNNEERSNHHSLLESNDGPEDENFFKSKDKNCSTKLSKDGLKYFILHSGLGCLLFLAIVFVFLFGQYTHNTVAIDGDNANKTKTKLYETIEKVSDAMYIWSFFFTLTSCMIFSKLMLGIRNKCNEQEAYITYVNWAIGHCQNINNIVGDNNKEIKDRLIKYIHNQNSSVQVSNDMQDNVVCLIYLKESDKYFARVAKDTLQGFQLWFFIHWLFHIFSALLSISLLVDAIVLHIKAVLPHTDPGIKFKPIEFFFLLTFMAYESFLVLYPCFQAAAVTYTRKQLIKSIIKKFHDYKHIDDEVKKDYITFMMNREFGFRIRVFCRTIPFNLNIAYISIGLGCLGVVISLLASV